MFWLRTSLYRGLQRWIPQSLHHPSHQWEAWKHTCGRWHSMRKDNEKRVFTAAHVGEFNRANGVLTFGCLQTVSIETLWQAEWGRTKTSRMHLPPTTRSSPSHNRETQTSKSCSVKQANTNKKCQTILTDWHSASRNFFAVQPMKMMEAEAENIMWEKSRNYNHKYLYIIYSNLAVWNSISEDAEMRDNICGPEKGFTCIYFT